MGVPHRADLPRQAEIRPIVGAIRSVGGGHGLGIHREIARQVQGGPQLADDVFPHHVGRGVPVDHPAALAERGSHQRHGVFMFGVVIVVVGVILLVLRFAYFYN